MRDVWYVVRVVDEQFSCDGTRESLRESLRESTVVDGNESASVERFDMSNHVKETRM